MSTIISYNFDLLQISFILRNFLSGNTVEHISWALVQDKEAIPMEVQNEFPVVKILNNFGTCRRFKSRRDYCQIKKKSRKSGKKFR